MAVFNIQSLDDYPENYNWLSEEDRGIILGYMNGMQALADHYYETYINNIEDHIETGNYIRQYNQTVTSLTGSKNAYATLGIMVEYDWPHHPGIWVLATREMAESYIADEEFNESDSTENQNTLLDYSDVGH